MRPRVLTYEAKGQGRPVVLVPGGLTGWLSWVPHAERLSAGWRTVRVQPIHNELGFAGRPGDPDYTAAIECESLRMTLDDLEIESADLVGWSGGGRALIEFALTCPRYVRTLTLVEPAAYWILDRLGDPDPEVAHLNEFLHGLAGREVTEDDLAEFAALAGLAPTADRARAHPAWPGWVPHRMALSWSSEQADRPDRRPAELADIDCPVLLVVGTATAAWLKGVVAALADRLPDVTVLELPGDHACHIQHIDAFLDAVGEHLA